MLSVSGAGVSYRRDRRRPWNWVSWWLSLFFVIGVAGATASAISHLAANEERTLTLTVVNATTDESITGAQVRAGEQSFVTDSQGRVRLPAFAESLPLAVEKVGFRPARVAGSAIGSNQPRIALEPSTIDGVVVDGDTRKPVSWVKVAALHADGTEISTTLSGPDGAFQLKDVPANASLRVEGGDYDRYLEPLGAQTSLEVGLRRSLLAGIITDVAGAPIQGAVVTAGIAQTVTVADGSFHLTQVPSTAGIVVAASGYEDALAVVPENRTLQLALVQRPIKAVYINPLISDMEADLDRLIDLIDRTELNALVIDIKQDTVYYDTGIAFFHDAGAVAPLYDPAAIVTKLHEHGIYAIARLVVFQDSLVAESRPDLAVLDVTNGTPWRDMNGVAWVNAMEQELWGVNANLAVEAASFGFDEIQYDYVRFPTDGDLTVMDFGQPYTYEARISAIVGFLTLTQERLGPTGAKLGADVFGYTLLVDDDLGIGQNVLLIAPLVDFLCPMIYPSHFPEGSLALDGHPNDFPYETIEISMALAAQKMPGLMLKVRPWLQDFSLPWLSTYEAADVRAQIDAAEAGGAGGWMLWDPNNRYHELALQPDPGLATPSPTASSPSVSPTASPATSPIASPERSVPIASPLAGSNRELGMSRSSFLPPRWPGREERPRRLKGRLRRAC